MRKITVGLLSVLILLSMAFPVFAIVGYWRVNVLVAYDEEWQWTANYVYAHSVEELAGIIICEVRGLFYDQFDIWFSMIAYKFWDSCDSPASADEMMDEAISETGFYTGMQVGSYVADILIVFTDQDIPGCYGYSDRELGVVLVEETYSTYVGQATDNVLQHELSHLYYCDDHWEAGLDCVMNCYPTEVGFQYYVPTALVTNNWCSSCIDTINNHRSSWGTHITGGGGGGSSAGPRGWAMCAW
jgi:hypothetical protein